MRTVTADELGVELTSYEEAIEIVTSLAGASPVETIRLDDALGRVCAADLVSPIDVPPFDNSSMDGWVVRAADIVDGHTRDHRRVATGAPIPDGFDTVVPWEAATEEAGSLIATATPRQFVRRAGHDIARGDVVVAGGERLTAHKLAAAAACGIARIGVRRSPSVGVLVTGDELVEPGAPLGPGQLYDSNSVLLESLLHAIGVTEVVVEHCRDDERSTALGLRRLAADHDLIVTTGGASVGERDWVRHTLERSGRVHLWRVAVRPGKPFAAATIDDVPVLCLPGNPASVATCFHVFVRRFVARMSGARDHRHVVHAPLATPLGNDSVRTWLCPMVLNDAVAHPLVASSSQALGPLAGSNGFTVVQPGGSYEVGRRVEIELHP